MAKVRLDELEKLGRAMDELPHYKLEEVTKIEAIRVLLPNIRAMQSRGYSMSAVAQFLSEHGFAVTTTEVDPTLRTTKAGSEGGSCSRLSMHHTN